MTIPYETTHRPNAPVYNVKLSRPHLAKTDKKAQLTPRLARDSAATGE